MCSVLPCVLTDSFCLHTTRKIKIARDLIEEGRCGRAHEIAASFGIKVSDTDPFWKDRTFLELNYAVRNT